MAVPVTDRPGDRADLLADVVCRAEHRPVISPAEVNQVTAARDLVRSISTRPTTIAIAAADASPGWFADLLGLPDPPPCARATGPAWLTTVLVRRRDLAVSAVRFTAVEYRTWDGLAQLRQTMVATLEQDAAALGLDVGFLATIRNGTTRNGTTRNGTAGGGTASSGTMGLGTTGLGDGTKHSDTAEHRGSGRSSDDSGWWSAVLAWARSVWAISPGLVRAGIHELVELHRAEQVGGAMVGQAPIPIAARMLLRAADLAARSGPPGNVADQPFPELPVGRPVSSNEFGLSDQDLARTLPLIQRVQLEVEVPASQWAAAQGRSAAPMPDEFVLTVVPPSATAQPATLTAHSLTGLALGEASGLLVLPGRDAQELTRTETSNLDVLTFDDSARNSPRVPPQRSATAADPIRVPERARDLLVAYLTGAAVRRREADAHRQLRELERLVRALVRRLRTDALPVPDDGRTPRRALRERLGEVADRFGALVTAARQELGDIDRPIRARPTPRCALAQEVAALVFAWPHWATLLDCAEGEWIHRPATAPDWPDTSTPFERSYLLALGELHAAIDRIVTGRLADWTSERDERLGELHGDVVSLLNPLLPALAGGGHDTTLDALRRATRPSLLRANIKLAQLAGDLAMRTTLPLPLGRALPWHPAYRNRPGHRRPHVATVLRMRREIVDALTRIATAQLTDRLREVSVRLIEELDRVHRNLPGLGPAMDPFIDAALQIPPAPEPVAVADTIAAVLDGNENPLWTGGTA